MLVVGDQGEAASVAIDTEGGDGAGRMLNTGISGIRTGKRCALGIRRGDDLSGDICLRHELVQHIEKAPGGAESQPDRARSLAGIALLEGESSIAADGENGDVGSRVGDIARRVSARLAVIENVEITPA